MFPDIWYIEKLPLERFTIVASHTQMHTWLVALKDDIEKRGMLSPLLVSNEEKRPYYIRHGNNRIQCLGLLEWTHAPCLSFGLPPDVPAVKMKNLAECQEYLRDGIIGYDTMNNTVRFSVSSTMVPECCKYPE
jgi:hypothetical protein